MKKLAAVMGVGVIMLELAGIAQAAVVINEVFYDAVGIDTGKEWIELKNTGVSSETITGYDLNVVSGDYYTFPALTVPAGCFVIVYWRKDGTNDTDFSDNVAHLYTGTSGFDANMGDTKGWVALFNSTTHSSSTIIDYMEYGAGGQTWESAAVSAGIWTAGDYATDVNPGNSLEYDGSGNTGADWFDQSVPTPGADNSLPVTLTSFTAT
ncbi:MAG: lamin tail domain-containing protein, partial [Candidatus Latescibacteria bacterium]|nr:lamin tail domain-containing protein [Candidatus Latescibacterota bacterium]